jgi:hypothetical protein
VHTLLGGHLGNGERSVRLSGLGEQLGNPNLELARRSARGCAEWLAAGVRCGAGLFALRVVLLDDAPVPVRHPVRMPVWGGETVAAVVVAFPCDGVDAGQGGGLEPVEQIAGVGVGG